ncbi:Rid family detoxifying hydrolase [Natrinema sp. 1APR25-10V2]|uniref:Rid family detoxifying hydrolase n=1 Tax=Natrinema sp. 1APR25-10V2 TaxID=2951081 RepID=UPI0028749A2C|nr:Rid family detoxifying hydrolase [Natrinema sp. 1APR25-10V2]MDS0476185.1 Rid family detoxifying hydrolase [Natrinema sp. 1APR25-10V2]
MKRLVSTDDAPAAVGAYSQATTNGDLLFTAGQLPLTLEGDVRDEGPVAVQTRQCLENVAAILAAEDLEMADILKVTVYLDDISDFDEMNEAYAEFFETSPPARSAIEVGSVPKGAAVEIEVVATLE